MKRLVAGLIPGICILAAPVFGRDLPASHCEAFINRAWAETIHDQIGDRSSVAQTIHLEVKVNRSLLDGELASLESFSRVLHRKGPDGYLGGFPFFCSNEADAAFNQCRNNVAARWLGSVGVHYELEAPASDPSDAISVTAAFEGAIVATTDKGTAYWVNPSPGKNFVFDSDFYSSLPPEAMPTGTDHRPFARYLNPLRCK